MIKKLVSVIAIIILLCGTMFVGPAFASSDAQKENVKQAEKEKDKGKDSEVDKEAKKQAEKDKKEKEKAAEVEKEAKKQAEKSEKEAEKLQQKYDEKLAKLYGKQLKSIDKRLEKLEEVLVKYNKKLSKVNKGKDKDKVTEEIAKEELEKDTIENKDEPEQAAEAIVQKADLNDEILEKDEEVKVEKEIKKPITQEDIKKLEDEIDKAEEAGDFAEDAIDDLKDGLNDIDKAANTNPDYSSKFTALQEQLDAITIELNAIKERGFGEDLLAPRYAKVVAIKGHVDEVLAAVNAVQKAFIEDKTAEVKEAKKDITNVNKPWNVKFNKALDEKQLSEMDIVVLDENKKVVETVFSPTGDMKTVTITPVSPYAPQKTYTVYIGKKIAGANGQKIKNSVKMNFSVK